MGLFSSKTITTVGTVVSRVVADASLPDSIKAGVIKAILQDGSMPDYIMEDMVGGIGVKAERMYEYAKRSYTHGLPSGQYRSAVDGFAAVTAVLSTLEGAPALLDYSHFGPPNNLHIGWMKLIALHGYDPLTNKLGNLTTSMGKDVYLQDINVVIPAAMTPTLEAGILDQWGDPARTGYTPQRASGAGFLLQHSPVISDIDATEEHLLVTYTHLIDDLYFVTSTFTVPLTGYLDEADYFHARYSVNGVVKYWMYQAGIGEHPSLDAVFNAPTEIQGTFFPFAYFRYAKQSMAADPTSEAYKTSKRLLKYLGMDFATMADSIDSNPDIADVEQAMMVMAVPANSANPLELRYLYEFFNNKYNSVGERFGTQMQGNVATQLATRDIVTNSIIIEDKLFKMALSNGGMFKKRKAGVIGPVGSHTSVTTEQFYEQTFMDALTGVPVTKYIPITNHFYRRQVSHAFYDEIQIANLKMVYHVFGQYTTTGDDLDKILLIPLDRSITEDFSIPDREVLYARSLHYVFNSRTLTKLKWYQQEWFGFLMIVVAVVVTVMTLGADGGTFLTLAAAIASGSTVAITAAVWALITQLLISLVISVALKLFVKAVGVKFAFLVAIVAAAYGIYGVGQTGGLAGAPWAQEMLQLASGLANTVGESLKEAMAGLGNEFKDLQLLKDAAAIDLERANDLLENNNWLSPLVLLGESPEDFYNRTMYSGNPGIMSIGAISSYVDIALTLPKLEDTLGESL